MWGYAGIEPTLSAIAECSTIELIPHNKDIVETMATISKKENRYK